eukprot:GDKI01044312.1.p1 GENE.GDKI01044312.1~~GDKI01044312.1.p1  ORF type:complete len:594 (-),score=179.54 GDKI01044312.1:173-1852(-)
MATIREHLNRLFGIKSHEFRALFIGLDATGRTTALYKIKLGEVVTTIPTIGFNVETVETPNKTAITIWDVGGCDKIRPLFRHYFSGTHVLVFFIDSNDRQRLDEAKSELMERILPDDALQGTAVYVACNKQDLPNAMKVSEIEDALGLKTDTHMRNRQWAIGGMVATSGHGLTEMLSFMESAAVGAKGRMDARQNEEAREKQRRQAEAARLAARGEGERVKEEMDELLERWLQQRDDSDELFIQKLDDYSLNTWDHRAHLRIAWILLTKHGRKAGMPLVFEKIKRFIENSPLTQRTEKRTTYHETMTYFWVHMVHYALEAASDKRTHTDFKTFLVLNPQLCNSGMFLHYYSKQAMLMDPTSRRQVVLPDKRPLPSIISKVDGSKLATEAHVQPTASHAIPTDEEFIQRFEAKTLPSWGHEQVIRTAYCYLAKLGRRQGLKAYEAGLRALQGGGYHESVNYFWFQMVTYAMAQDYGTIVMGNGNAGVAEGGRRVPEFRELLGSSKGSYSASKLEALLLDSRLYLQYYSKSVIEGDQAAAELVLPDKKPLPNLVPSQQGGK